MNANSLKVAHVVEIINLKTGRNELVICDLPASLPYMKLVTAAHEAMIQQSKSNYKIERIFRLRVDYRTERQIEAAAKCPNGYFPLKEMCGNAHNCDPEVCWTNRIQVAESTQEES